MGKAPAQGFVPISHCCSGVPQQGVWSRRGTKECSNMETAHHPLPPPCQVWCFLTRQILPIWSVCGMKQQLWFPLIQFWQTIREPRFSVPELGLRMPTDLIIDASLSLSAFHGWWPHASILPTKIYSRPTVIQTACWGPNNNRETPGTALGSLFSRGVWITAQYGNYIERKIHRSWSWETAEQPGHRKKDASSLELALKTSKIATPGMAGLKGMVCSDVFI